MTSVKIEPFFGGFVLETLTVGMYGESRNAIREYIQNGFDSILKARKQKLLTINKGTIQIEMAENGDFLTIRDDGAGLPVATSVATLTSVGASTKDPSNSAGFRGIGRLAGIGFCNSLTFTTKSSGENEMTTVVFNGRLMRDLMSPKQGSSISADELLRKCVTATILPSNETARHFFEVHLEGLVEAPEECRNVKLMEEFVSQVAPIGYHSSFPFKTILQKAATDTGIPIEEINLTLKDGDNDARPVTKVYRDKYRVDTGDTELSECRIQTAEDGVSWWGWIGKKAVSGMYLDPTVSGLRVRMKNIQIDGTDVVRDIFKKRARDSARFQDWFVGEIFVKPSYLVPNARRDGFEDTKAWKEMRIELTDLIKELDADARSLSDTTQISLGKIANKVMAKHEEIDRLRRGDFKNIDKILEVSNSITKILGDVAKATKNASPAVLADLQVFASELTDIKAEAVSKITTVVSDVDVEDVRQEACNDLLEELIVLFEENLQPSCFNSVRTLLRNNYGVGL